jgi:hypothetical protein
MCVQAAFLVAVSTLPPEFTLSVPSATPGQTYDTKTVKNWWALADCESKWQEKITNCSYLTLTMNATPHQYVLFIAQSSCKCFAAYGEWMQPRMISGTCLSPWPPVFGEACS